MQTFKLSRDKSFPVASSSLRTNSPPADSLAPSLALVLRPLAIHSVEVAVLLHYVQPPRPSNLPDLVHRAFVKPACVDLADDNGLDLPKRARLEMLMRVAGGVVGGEVRGGEANAQVEGMHACGCVAGHSDAFHLR
jgi:hypothetical protein